jgi:fatty acid desaturase
VLYWNMNYHIEHHVYPSVPFHALPALNAAIKDQLPEPSPSLIAAHVEIVRVILAQRTDPHATASPPLPRPLAADAAGPAAGG